VAGQKSAGPGRGDDRNDAKRIGSGLGARDAGSAAPAPPPAKALILKPGATSEAAAASVPPSSSSSSSSSAAATAAAVGASSGVEVGLADPWCAPRLLLAFFDALEHAIAHAAHGTHRAAPAASSLSSSGRSHRRAIATRNGGVTAGGDDTDDAGNASDDGDDDATVNGGDSALGDGASGDAGSAGVPPLGPASVSVPGASRRPGIAATLTAKTAGSAAVAPEALHAEARFLFRLPPPNAAASGFFRGNRKVRQRLITRPVAM